jgi:hypothetical protein
MNHEAGPAGAERGRRDAHDAGPLRRGRPLSLGSIAGALAAATLAVLMWAGAASAQSGPAVSITPGPYLGGAYGGGSITYGWQFEPNADITITELGFSDGAPYSTIGLGEPHQVGIFDSKYGDLIVSATIPAGAEALLDHNFWYVPIPPTQLLHGLGYTIGALLPAPRNDVILLDQVAPGEPPAITFDPRITWLQGVSDWPGTDALTFPDHPCCDGPPVVGFFGPTFYMGVRPAMLQVTIDIKPGGSPNSINLKNSGKIPVAVLSGAAFDAPGQVNQASLTFGRTGYESSLAQCSSDREDVNEDGLPDLVCHFTTQATGLQPGDAAGVLEGTTAAGLRFRGADSVRVVNQP